MIPRFLVFLCALLTLQPFNTSYAVAVDQTAPNCSLATLEGGSPYTLQQFHGKVVYVDFWASWCPPCAKSFPFLNQLEHDFKVRGLRVVAINLDEDLADAKAFLTSHPADFVVALDAHQQCAQAFGVAGMPSSYLIDHKGVVRHVAIGFKSEATGELRALVEKLLIEAGAK